jgi:hypothetical protein
MAALAVVCWRDKTTGATGKGINPTPWLRGERLVENLNRNFPGFEHWLEPATATTTEKEG